MVLKDVKIFIVLREKEVKIEDIYRGCLCPLRIIIGKKGDKLGNFEDQIQKNGNRNWNLKNSP